MLKRGSLLGSASLAVLLAAGMAGQAQAAAKHHHHAARVDRGAENEAKIDSLTATVSDLENRLNDATTAVQQANAAAQAASAKADQAEADEQAMRGEVEGQIQTVPGEIQTAVNAAKPKTDKMYYKGITITPGGFLEMAGIYRSRNLDSDVGSPAFAKIPFANNAVSHTQELRFSARQSRVSFLAQGAIDPNTTAAFYVETDFLGAAQTANSNESNSFNLRIRNVYGSLDWSDSGWHWLAGQNWSLATLSSKGITPRNEVIPPTIDAQYIPGFTWARQPQIRLTKDFEGKQVWVAVSLENPQSTFTGSPATGIVALDGAAGSTLVTSASPAGPTGVSSSSLLTNINTFSLNHVPDVVGKIAFEPMIDGAQPLHVELFGIWRDFYDRINVNATNVLHLPSGITNSDTSGGGVGVGATWTVVPKTLDVQGSFLTGSGIGRYGAGGLPDFTLMPSGKIAVIGETMFLVGGTVHATPDLDLYLFYGQEQDSSKAFNAAGSHFGYGNPFFVNTGCLSEVLNGTTAATCTGNVKTVDQVTAGVWDKVYSGPFGYVRVGLQYSHTELDAFAGEGASAVPGSLAPHSQDDMVFTSFRYYPF